MKISTVIFETKVEAEKVRRWLNEIIAEYGYASAADFYDMVGETCYNADTKYGWKNFLNDELIVSTANGWTIDFPEVCEL